MAPTSLRNLVRTGLPRTTRYKLMFMLSAELWGKRVHVRTMWRSIAAVSVHNACADTRTQTHRSSRITGILYRKGDREMIDANVLRAVGEVLETHGVTPKSGEGNGGRRRACARSV